MLTDEQIIKALIDCDVPMRSGVVRATVPELRAIVHHIVANEPDCGCHRATAMCAEVKHSQCRAAISKAKGQS